MTATKKLPVPAKPKSGKGRFLIPDLLATGGSGFIDIKTGKRVETGHLCYLGVPVTAEDILTRFCEQHALAVDPQAALDRLDLYIAALQDYKIGNVLSITYAGDGSFRLTKEADQPPPLQKPRLP